MSLYKYKTFEEAEKALWVKDPDSTYFKKVNDLFDTAEKLNSIIYPRGIFYYETLEEANNQRRKWEIEFAVKKKKD